MLELKLLKAQNVGLRKQNLELQAEVNKLKKMLENIEKDKKCLKTN